MKRIGFIIILFLGFFGFILFLYSNSERDKRNLIKNEIATTITEVNVNAKKTPLVTLSNSDYKINFAHFNVSLLSQIEVGDSLFKRSNSRELEHYKIILSKDSMEYITSYYIEN